MKTTTETKRVWTIEEASKAGLVKLSFGDFTDDDHMEFVTKNDLVKIARMFQNYHDAPYGWLVEFANDRRIGPATKEEREASDAARANGGNGCFAADVTQFYGKALPSVFCVVRDA